MPAVLHAYEEEIETEENPEVTMSSEGRGDEDMKTEDITEGEEGKPERAI